MAARIYKPAKTAMQSGQGKTKTWILEFVADQPRGREPLMGWTSSADTKQQLKLKFESQAAAAAYAKKNGLAYRVETPKAPARQKKSYSENFKWGRPQPWTH